LLKKNSEQSWCVLSEEALDDTGGRSESFAGNQWIKVNVSTVTQLPFTKPYKCTVLQETPGGRLLLSVV